MGLFGPKMLSGNEKAALNAVERENDEKALFGAVLESPLQSVQSKALSKITDQELLYSIACCHGITGNGTFIYGDGKYSIKNLSDRTRTEAVKRLDTDRLIAASGNMWISPSVRQAVIDALFDGADEALLEKVMKDSSAPDIKADAGSRLCSLKGHEWNFCRCVRCGEKRDEGHDLVLIGTTVEDEYRPVEIKRFRCSVCGKEIETTAEL